MKDLFEPYRFNKLTHLGLGDIRLTVGAQEEIMAQVRQLIAEATYDGMLQGRYVECAIVEERAQREMADIAVLREKSAKRRERITNG